MVTRVILTIKKQGLAGTDPFATHQNIQIDIATGNFGFDSYLGSLALQPLDFQAPSTLDAVGRIRTIQWGVLLVVAEWKCKSVHQLEGSDPTAVVVPTG